MVVLLTMPSVCRSHPPTNWHGAILFFLFLGSILNFTQALIWPLNPRRHRCVKCHTVCPTDHYNVEKLHHRWHRYWLWMIEYAWIPACTLHGDICKSGLEATNTHNTVMQRSSLCVQVASLTGSSLSMIVWLISYKVTWDWTKVVQQLDFVIAAIWHLKCLCSEGLPAIESYSVMFIKKMSPPWE